MTAISNRLPAVTVEYDWRNTGKRVTKEFEDANAAKKFYAKKLKDGKNPKLVEADASAPANTKQSVTEKLTTTDKPKTGDDKPVPQGVSHKLTRPYFAGVVIQNHGVEAGVTAAMVTEVDKLYGQPNPRESRFCLKNAWHAIRGYGT